MLDCKFEQDFLFLFQVSICFPLYQIHIYVEHISESERYEDSDTSFILNVHNFNHISPQSCFTLSFRF